MLCTLQKENGQTKDAVTKKIKEMEELLNQKNSYINNFRKPDVVQAATMRAAQAETNPQSFDNVFEMEDETQDRSQYCQKCKYESRWCKHRKIRDDNKQQQAAVLTSSQTLGWREPYDNLTFGNARTGMCKRTFHDPGHL